MYSRVEGNIVASYGCINTLEYIEGPNARTCQNTTWVPNVGECGKSMCAMNLIWVTMTKCSRQLDI